MAGVPPLRLPDEFVDIARTVVDLDPTALKGVEETLSSIGDEIDRSSTAQALDSLQLPDTSGERLLTMLISLAGLWQEARIDDPRAIARAFAASPDLDGEDLDRVLLEDRLSVLMTTPAVDLLGRGLDLLAEHEHLMSDARILSDVRLLFDKGQATQVDGGVIGHVLRITFARGEPRSIDIALDTDDLGKLEGLIKRAQGKETTLRRIVNAQQVPLVIPFAEERYE